jgi:hypothetical protein
MVVCFLKKVNNIFNMSSSKLKLVRTRRSTVLSLPLSLGFPGFSFFEALALKGGLLLLSWA